MDPRDLITTAEAARLLAVGPTSVKRWADSGVLTCVKTAGGHRRFRRSEVEAFLRGRGHELPDEGAGLDNRLVSWVELLVAESDLHAVAGRLMSERGERGAWWRVADALGAAVTEIGRRWHAGELTIMQERLASERLLRGLAFCSAQVQVHPRASRALLVTPEGDEHIIGLALAEICAREAGWQTLWAGHRTPTDEVIAKAASGTVDLIAYSASGWSANAAQLEALADRVGRACADNRVALVFGGSGAWPQRPTYGHRIESFAMFHSLLTRTLSP